MGRYVFGASMMARPARVRAPSIGDIQWKRALSGCDGVGIYSHGPKMNEERREEFAARTLFGRRSPALERRRRFVPAGPCAAALPLRRRPGSEGKGDPGDRENREEPLVANRLDNLKPDQNDPRVGER